MIRYLSKMKSLTILLMGILIFSCSMSRNEEDERTLKMVYTDWSESVALTYLSSVLLEEKMDYTVILKLTDVESAYKEVANGNADVFADAWLPDTHKSYYDEYSFRETGCERKKYPGFYCKRPEANHGIS